MFTKEPILTLDVPNNNKRTYTKEAMIEACKKAQERIANSQMFVTMGICEGNGIDMEKVIGMVKGLSIEDDKVVADLKFIATPIGTTFKHIIETGGDSVMSTFAFRPVGFGTVGEDGVIGDDYEFAYVSMISAEEAA